MEILRVGQRSALAVKIEILNGGCDYNGNYGVLHTREVHHFVYKNAVMKAAQEGAWGLS